jgi:hypothetical protein
MKAAEIIQEACDIAQAECNGEGSFREGLEAAIDGVDRHSQRTARHRQSIRQIFIQTLATRMQVEKYAHRHPEVRDGDIKRPVFIIGLMRTGTTMLSYLLGADPGRRPLLRWETEQPIPPPTTAELYSNPIIDIMEITDKFGGSAGAIYGNTCITKRPPARRNAR